MNCKISKVNFLAFILILLTGCVRLNPSPNPIPEYPKIGVTTVLIEPLKIFNTVTDSTNKPFIDLLQEISTAQMLNFLYRQRIGQDVVRLYEANSQSQLVIVSAVVSLPVSLPKEISGINASMQEGILAKISISVKEADRALITTEESINWDEVRWSSGANKVRRRRPTDEVLIDAVSEVVKKGIFKIQAELNLENNNN